MHNEHIQDLLIGTNYPICHIIMIWHKKLSKKYLAQSIAFGKKKTNKNKKNSQKNTFFFVSPPCAVARDCPKIAPRRRHCRKSARAVVVLRCLPTYVDVHIHPVLNAWYTRPVRGAPIVCVRTASTRNTRCPYVRS